MRVFKKPNVISRTNKKSPFTHIRLFIATVFPKNLYVPVCPFLLLYIQRSVSILRIDGETVIRDIAQQILVEPESIGELIQLILTTAFKAGTHIIPISQMRKLSPVSKLCVSQGGAGL